MSTHSRAPLRLGVHDVMRPRLSAYLNHHISHRQSPSLCLDSAFPSSLCEISIVRVQTWTRLFWYRLMLLPYLLVFLPFPPRSSLDALMVEYRYTATFSSSIGKVDSGCEQVSSPAGSLFYDHAKELSENVWLCFQETPDSACCPSIRLSRRHRPQGAVR